MAMDYIDKAEQAILAIRKKDKQGKIIERYGKYEFFLTKNQIRKFLTAVNMLRNRVEVAQGQNPDSKVLSEELAMEIKFLRVNLLYQAGRERAVNDFAKSADLEKMIQDIGNSTEKFEQFCKYVEALVAFHKYYGGSDK